MPKKPRNKQKFKLNKRQLILAVLALLALALITAQLCFNVFVWWSLQQQTAFQMRTLIVGALDDLDAQKKSLTDNQKIPEARLILPQENDKIYNIRYFYNEPSDESPVILYVTTRTLAQTASALLNGNNVGQLMKAVPLAQACDRGFTIYVGKSSENNIESEQFVATKKLNDGREINITKDKGCSSNNSAGIDAQPISEMMNDLEQYLIQTQSY